MSIIDDAMYEIQVKVSEIAKKEGKMIDDAIFGYIQRIADEEGIKLDIHLNRDFIIDALQNRYVNTVKYTVKHGEWIQEFDAQENYARYYCSECHGEPYYERNIRREYKFCPYCGARMDGEE